MAGTVTSSSAAPLRNAASIPASTSIPDPGACRIITAGCCITASVLGVALEPFIQTNYQAYIHNSKAFGGVPQRYRTVKADYHGHVAELLAKATRAKALDGR